MPGTILKDDLQGSIEDQLQSYARSLNQNILQPVQQTVGDTLEDLQRAGRSSLQDVQAQLSEYATQAYNQAQQAADAARQAAADQAQQQANNAANVQKQLTDYANQVVQGNQQTNQVPTDLSQPQPGTGALPHSSEPATSTDVTGLGSKWKTQFDFGATYTGDYRTGTPHRGVDLVPANGGGIGTEVDAFAPGTVTNVFRDPGGAGGLIVYVQDSDGLTHAYMHLQQADVKVGDQVQRGQHIAEMGESGTEGSPHLHYEVRKNAASGDPLNQLIDPRPYEQGTKQPGGAAVATAPTPTQASPLQSTLDRVGQGKDAFIDSVAGLAKQVGDATGIDPAILTSIAGWETGWGQSSNAQKLNNLFSIQGNGQNGSRWAGYDSPAASFQAFVDLVSGAPRYAQAWADRHNPVQFVNDLRQAGYVVDEPGYPAQGWVDGVTRTYTSIRDQVGQAVENAPAAVSDAVGGAITGGRRAASDVLQAGLDRGQETLQPLVIDHRQALEQLNALQDQISTLRDRINAAQETPPLAAGTPARQALDTAGETIGQGFSGLGSATRAAFTEPPEVQAARAQAQTPEGRRQQLADLAGVPVSQVEQDTLGLGTGLMAGAAGEAAGQEGSARTGDAAALAIIQRGKAAGWNPTPEQEQFTRTALGQTLNPMNVIMTIAAGPEGLTARGLVTALTQIAAQGLGTAAGEAGAPNLPEGLRPFAPLVGGFVGPLAGDIGLSTAAGGVRSVAERPGVQEALRSRQPAQAQVGAALGGVPNAVARVRGNPPDVLEGMAVPRPGYEPGTPEFVTDQALQDAARRQGTPTPNLSQAELQQLPGLEGTRMRDLNEVREAVEAGMPAARWYEEVVQQVRQDTGQDINPREAAVLMGAFGGNAGVQANYHAMLSVFDAMRRAKPDLSGFEDMTVPQIQASPEYARVEALVGADAGYADRTMLARVMRGYRTGEIPVPSGAKLSSYTQNFLNALNDLYDPYSTQDVWQGRLFGSRLQSATRGADVIPGTPDVSGNDAAYRSMHSLTNWIAREMNIPPRQAQAAGWTVFRTLWNDPIIGPGLKTDAIGLSDAIRQGYASGVLHPPSMATAGLQEVAGPRINAAPGTNPTINKINDVRDRIAGRAVDANGNPLAATHNTPPPDTATAIQDWALYHPSIQSAAQQRGVLDPSGFQYGKTVGASATRPRRPVGNGPAAVLRDLAISDSPILRVRGGDISLDENGKIPWLVPEHDVQKVGPNTYVNVVGIGDEAAHVVGRRLGADSFNHADPNARGSGGLAIDGLPGQAEQARIAQALQGEGLPVIREQTGTGIRVPLTEGKIGALGKAVQRVLANEGAQANVVAYSGETHAVNTAGAGRARGARNQSSAAGPLGVPAGNELRGQRLAASLFRDAPGADFPAAQPPGTGVGDVVRAAVARRARGEANVPFAINAAGGLAGGIAGNAATPEGASPEERLRNIGLGALTGLAATHGITRGLAGPLRPAEVAPGRVSEGFRAPEARQGLELRATTQEPPGGPGEVPPRTVSGREPRTLGEVYSNRYALREAAPGETPMSADEMLSYASDLEDRYQAVQNQRDTVDEMIRNAGQKIDRPRWAAGLTEKQIAYIAREHGASPYEEGWYDRVGLEEGSGEVRDELREGRWIGNQELLGKKQTPAELRRERTLLDAELGAIEQAHAQMANAPAEPNLVRVTSAEEAARATAPTELPFDTGAPPEPGAAPVGEAGGARDEGARTAQEIVLSKGRGSIRQDRGEISGQRGGIVGTALTDAEAVQRAVGTPPSARTEANMPNLDSMVRDEPVIAAQIRRAVEDNPDLFEAYRQGRISQDSLKNDLATRVGMSLEDWKKTKVGQGFNPEELVALQAAAIEQQGRLEDLGRDILAKGGIDELSPEELAFSVARLADATQILAVARGGRTTAGRTLNALKNVFDRTQAQGITASNERIAAQRLASQARRAAAKATSVLTKGRELEREATTAKAEASRQGAPKNIIDQIAKAYDDLDKYNAMTLHEKAAVQDALKAERAKRAAARKARVRGAPEELLKALQDELRAEQDNFARRRDTWETMAFWDSKSFENAMQKRTNFRGQLYIEQQRKVANIAAKNAEKEAAAQFTRSLNERVNQQKKTERLLEAIGGREVTKEVLGNFLATLNDPDPGATAKFLKGMAKQTNWGRAAIVRIAGLVSAPITHMVNLGGNTAGALIEDLAVRPTVVGIDKIRAAVTGGERQAYAGELLPSLQAYGPGFLGSLGNAVRVLRTGINPNEAADLSKIRAGFQSGNEVVDAAVEMPLRLLTAEDVLFRGGATAYHATRVATREAIREGFRGKAVLGRANSIIKNLEDYPELAKEVADAAARDVYQERRNIPLPRQFPGQDTAATRAGRAAVQQVVPFVQTPANITAQGIAMSPLGFAGALEAMQGAREMPRGTRAERYAQGRQTLLAEERAARAMLGTGLLGAGLALGAAGMMTAAYPEDPKEASTLPQGWRPWSLRLRNPIDGSYDYIPLQNLGVMGMPLAMAAIATDPTHKGKNIFSDSDTLGQAATGIGKYVIDNTFLQGVSDFIDALQDPQRRGSKFAEGLVASYGPYSSLGREMQRAFGVASRNPREGLRGLIDAMEANYPGLSGNVPPTLTPLGEERTQGATGLGRLIPYRYDVERDEPTLQALRLGNVGVPAVPKAVGVGRGYGVDLTEDERVGLQRSRGQAIIAAVDKLRQNPRFAAYERTLNTAPRNSPAYADALTRYNGALQAAVSGAAESANNQFVRQLGRDQVQARMKLNRDIEPTYLGAPPGPALEEAVGG